MRFAAWWYRRAIARCAAAGLDVFMLRLQETYCQAWVESEPHRRELLARHFRILCRQASDLGYVDRDGMVRLIDQLCDLEVDVRRGLAN